jgi:hypothetical protein
VSGCGLDHWSSVPGSGCGLDHWSSVPRSHHTTFKTPDYDSYLKSLHFIINFTFIILSISSSCFSFIFASDIFVLTSLTTAIAKILAQIQRIR